MCSFRPPQSVRTRGDDRGRRRGAAGAAWHAALLADREDVQRPGGAVVVGVALGLDFVPVYDDRAVPVPGRTRELCDWDGGAGVVDVDAARLRVVYVQQPAGEH